MIDWSNKSVLIAEDEPTNFLLLAEYLEPTRIKVIRAKNGLEVLKQCEEAFPDIILLDMKMPRMNGFETVAKIREINKEIPIIAQTAYAMVGDKEKILAAGCNDYLPKPIEEDSLINKMMKYLNY